MANPILNLGNNEWATKSESLLGYSKSGSNFKSVPFTHSRASIGTTIDRNGVLQTEAGNIPRIDFKDNIKGSLLLESQRTNYITYSEDFTQWNSARGTLDVNNTISPTGSLNGSLYTKNESANEGYIFRDLTVSSVGTYTTSVFFKYSNNQYVHFLLWDGGGNGVRCYFDIQNGNVGNAVAFGTTFSASDLSMEDYGNGWYKCSAKFTTTGTDTIWQFRFSPSGGNNSPNSNTGAKFYFFGAQLEQGSYPTSYIQTEGSTVTRLGDKCFNGGNADLFNITEGTLFLDFEAFTPEDNSKRLLSLSEQSNYNRLLLIPYTYNQLRLVIQANGSLDVSAYGVISYNTRQKVAVSYELNSVKFYINGTLVFTGTSVGTFSNLTKIAFADVDNSLTAPAKIYELIYFDSVISQSDLETLTTL